jgi:predicted ester cyclase
VTGEAQSNKDAAIRLFDETFNRHNLAVADQVLAPDLVFHNAGTEIRGPSGWKAFAGEWLQGFPDTNFTVDFSMAEGDRVLLHWRATGTHTGEFRRRRATGRHITASGLSLMRLSGGKIVEMWDETEAFGELEGLTIT